MYARVAEAENGEPVEIPVEDDGTILLSTLQGAFPGLTGLKYRAPSGAFRALKLVGQSVCTPECGWESALFVGVFPKEVRRAAIAANGNGNGENGSCPSASVSAALKPNCEADIALNAAAMSSLDEDELRRGDERDLDSEERDRSGQQEGAVRSGEFDAAVSVGGDKQLSLPTGVCDLIVLGLSFRATEADLRHYFERFGELQFAEVKRDRHSEESRGFAFVRFRSHEAQTRCLLEKEHLVLGRRCDVRLPFKEQEKDKLPDLDANREAVFLAPAGDKLVANKLFVGRLPAEINEDDLRLHFGMFGKLSDCYIPKPFRAFAFVTFFDALDAQKAFDTPTHVVKGATLNVTFAAPKRADEPFEPAAPAPARDRFPPRHARGGGASGAPSGFPPSRGAESLRHAAIVAAAPHALPFNHRNAGGQFQRGSAYGVQRKAPPQSPPSFPTDYQAPQRSSEYSSHDRHERSRSSRDHYRSRDRSRTRSRSRSRSRSPARHASYGHSSGGIITAGYTQPTGAGATQSDVSAAYAAAAYEQAQRFYAYYSAVAQATAASQQQAAAAQAQPASASANAAFNNMMAQAAASGVNPFTQFAGVSTIASASGAQSSSLPRGGVPPPPPPPASGWQHSQSSSGKGGWWGR